MKITINKSILMTLLVTFMIAIISMFSINTYAIEQPPDNVTPIDDSSSNDGVDEQLPDVSTNQMNSLISRKMYDIIHVLQTFGKYACIILFIVFSLVALIGGFGKAGFTGGFIGMFICGIVYTCILYAPQICNFFSGWLLN